MGVMPLLIFSQAAYGLTLQEAFKSAVKHRALIAVKKVDQEIARKEKSQALSKVLPTITGSSQSEWLDTVILSGDTRRFGEGYQHTAKITVEQPIFQGGAEYYGLKIANTDIGIAELERTQAELNLYGDVADGFYNLLVLKQDIATLKEQESVLKKRVVFLRQRARIGRSKISEVTQARSQLARIIAQLSQKQSEHNVAKRNFLWLTGLGSLDHLTDLLKDSSLPVSNEWAEQVLYTPQVKAKELLLKNAKNKIRAAQTDFLPEVDLEGSYYLDRDGILSSSKWDLSLLATWEFFSGGSTLTEAKIQTLEAKKLELELKDLKSRLVQDYAAQKEKLELQKQTLEKLKLAEKLAKQNYKEQQEEFNRGLISNLDVLRALDDHLIVKSSYDRERFSSQLTWVRLKLLAGLTP